MSVEVDRGGAPLSSLTPGAHQSSHLNNSNALSAWLKKQLDGPYANATPPEMPEENLFTEEVVMDIWSAAPSPYDPVLGQSSLNNEYAHPQTPSGGPWDGKYSDAALSGIEANGRYVSPQVLTTQPGLFMTTGSTTSASLPTYGLTVERTIYDNTRPNSAFDTSRPHSAHITTNSNTPVGPFGYMNPFGSNPNMTPAGLLSLAHTASLPNFATTMPLSYSSAHPQSPAPTFGNDPGFQQTAYHPPPAVARGTAAIERYQNQVVHYNVHAPGVSDLIPQSPMLRKTKRDAETAGLDYDDSGSRSANHVKTKPGFAKKPKKSRSTTSPNRTTSPTRSDPDASPTPSSEPTTPAQSSRKRKQKIQCSPDSPTAPASATQSKVKKAVPKTAEERRQRHNESEKRRRDIFKGLRDKLFKSVPQSVEIGSKTLGGKHKAVVQWVLELRRGNLALWNRALTEGVSMDGLDLRNGKRELERDPRLFFELDEVGGRGEDAATGLRRILETMTRIKADRKDLVI